MNKNNDNCTAAAITIIQRSIRLMLPVNAIEMISVTRTRSKYCICLCWFAVLFVTTLCLV